MLSVARKIRSFQPALLDADAAYRGQSYINSVPSRQIRTGGADRLDGWNTGASAFHPLSIDDNVSRRQRTAICLIIRVAPGVISPDRVMSPVAPGPTLYANDPRRNFL
jgi:hypothetical protein